MKHVRTLAKSSTFGRLPCGMKFTVQGCSDTFVKMANSNAINDVSGKDAIFAMHDKCKPLGLKTGFFPVWNWL